MPLKQSDFKKVIEQCPAERSSEIEALLGLFANKLPTNRLERYNYIKKIAEDPEFKFDELIPVVKELPAFKYLKEWLISGLDLEAQMEIFINPGEEY